MNQKPTFKESLLMTLKEISLKEKILIVLQSVLAIAILAIALLGMNGIINNNFVSTIDLALLSALLTVSAIRNYPERKMSSVIYMICTVLVIIILVFSFLK